MLTDNLLTLYIKRNEEKQIKCPQIWL